MPEIEEQSAYPGGQILAFEREWTQVSTGRECGQCYACCVYLGVTELGKYANQACKHLRGHGDGTKRCSIYERRPGACSVYQCMWRAGWGPEGLRPSECGFMLTTYPAEMGGDFAISMHVFKDLKPEFFNKVATELLHIAERVELRVIFVHRKKALLFKEGEIFDCDLLPQKKGNLEGLDFVAHDPPIGTYFFKSLEEEKPR